jgi:cell division protein ZipA
MGRKRREDVSGDNSDARETADAEMTEAQAAGRQKIVALRLIASADRWPGRAVTEALESEGLTFGKYSIYHRARDDGKSIFFVASMVEPGSFDLDNIDKLSFPGISIFAVIPSPIDAPITFDMMLSAARRLADRLGGSLQDEQGSTLTAQRILNLREELVHFEHVTRRVLRR